MAGRNKKISDKIGKLVKEGYSQDQATAIAYDMADRGKLKDGGSVKPDSVELVPNEPVYEYNLGGKIGSALGAGIGTIVAPGVGTTVGATLGGSVGSLAGEALSEDEKKQQEVERLPGYDEASFKSKGQEQTFYQSGGQVKPAQYEVEKGEVIDGGDPQAVGKGSMKEMAEGNHLVKGNTHENGGVKGTGGERVFSDHLKIPGTDKTFADAAKKVVSNSGQKSLEKKQEARPFDEATKNSLERTQDRNEAQKDKLFQIQEQIKDNNMSGSKMKEGGWIQKATKRMEKKGTKGSLTEAAKNAGYDSAMKYARHIMSNKDSYSDKMVQKANFAINANKRYGGGLPGYKGGGKLYQQGGVTPGYANTIPEENIVSPDVGEPTTGPYSPSDGRSPAPQTGPNPFAQYIGQKLEDQSDIAGGVRTASQVAQAVPYAYDLFTSGDKNYIPEVENRRADESLSQLRQLPTEYDIRPQLNQISDSYDAMTDKIGTYSTSPQRTRASIRQGFADRLKAEDQAYGQKINRENQLESQKRRALAEQQYQVGTQSAKFRDQKNVRDARVDANAEMQTKSGLSGLSEVARGSGMDFQRRMRDNERLALLSELHSDTGVMSRQAVDPEFAKMLKENYPDLYKKQLERGNVIQVD